MSNAIRVEEPLIERLTWAQICERYPDEWVVMVETDWVNDRDFEFGTTHVIGHYKTRKEASPHIKAAFQHYSEIGSFWTGVKPFPLRRFVP